jgi:signal transduction histidine kinase
MPGNHMLLLPDAPRFTIAAISDEYLAAIGREREPLIGKGLTEAFYSGGLYKDIQRDMIQSLGEVLRTGQAHHMAVQRYQLFNPGSGQNESRAWRPCNKPVLADDGTVAYIINSAVDVSPALQLKEVAQANIYLQRIIDEFKEPLQVLQPVFEGDQIVDFRFRFTNQAYAAYADKTPAELEGKRVGEVFPGYFQTSSFSNPVQTYKTGETLMFELHYKQDGLDLYNRMTSSKIGDEVFIYFTDLSDLKRTQVLLEEKVDELRRSNSYLEEFAYAASHDLKEPVRKIQAFSTRLKRSLSTGLSETDQDVFNRLQSAANRMGTLIDDLLSYASLSNHVPDAEPVELNAVVLQVLEDLELEIEQKGARVETCELCTIPGNRRQWEQAFQNLISNALKYSRPGVPPVITIECSRVSADKLRGLISADDRRPTFYSICIRDNGIGFEQQYAERIFQVFTRLHGMAEYKGSGVGLATVRKVVEAHNGYIRAEGVPDEGAAFTLLLPAV